MTQEGEVIVSKPLRDHRSKLVFVMHSPKGVHVVGIDSPRKLTFRMRLFFVDFQKYNDIDSFTRSIYEPLGIPKEFFELLAPANLNCYHWVLSSVTVGKQNSIEYFSPVVEFHRCCD